jgi:hypothetical protein
VKRVFEFDLGPKPVDEAMMYRALLLGEGEFWSGLSAYGAKGYQLTGTGSQQNVAGNPISTNGVWRTTTGQTMELLTQFYSQGAVGPSMAGTVGATAIGWRFDGSAYRIFGFSRRALDTVTPAVKREMLGSLGSSGVAQNYTGTETFSATSTALTITAPGAGGPWSWSNITVLPWFFPQAQVDALMLGLSLTTQLLPVLPRVYVTSDLLPTSQLKASPTTEQASVICHGEIESLSVQPILRSGAFSATECRMSGRLIEV